MATDQTCWAGPLTPAERRELAAKLARARGRFYRARLYWLGTDPHMLAQTVRASIDTSRLLLDVNERAKIPGRGAAA